MRKCIEMNLGAKNLHSYSGSSSYGSFEQYKTILCKSVKRYFELLRPIDQLSKLLGHNKILWYLKHIKGRRCIEVFIVSEYINSKKQRYFSHLFTLTCFYCQYLPDNAFDDKFIHLFASIKQENTAFISRN